MVLQADTAALRIPTPAFDVVAVAASLGGLNALSQVLSALPPDFPASIVVVQHLAAQYPSELAAILDRRTALAVTWAAQGQALRPATAYVAPPDRHVLVTPQGALALSRAPKVHHVRPSADRLFASVACRCKDRAIGVVLTGPLCDGAAGAQAIK